MVDMIWYNQLLCILTISRKGSESSGAGQLELAYLHLAKVEELEGSARSGRERQALSAQIQAPQFTVDDHWTAVLRV